MKKFVHSFNVNERMIFSEKMDEKEREILYSPRDGEEMEHALLNKVPIHKYSDLCRLSEKFGIGRMLAHMFKRSDDNVILLQDPRNMNSGHWISVSRIPKRKEIYFFSTYGGKPDVEKLSWMSDDDLKESGQDLNIFNDGLKELQKHGWEIHYNDYPYQKEGDHTAVCGIYTAAFLRSGKNPDKFKEETLKIRRKTGKDPALYYYQEYFL